jgi:hypothetical protein
MSVQLQAWAERRTGLGSRRRLRALGFPALLLLLLLLLFASP